MEYSIKQTDDGWIIVDANGVDVDAIGYDDYESALRALGTFIGEQLAEAAPLAVNDEQGLLPEEWVSDQGIAFSIATPGGRDFSMCEWSWRDPNASLLPVMFQSKNLPAHMEADLAGFITELSGGGVGAVQARGRFYDSEMGRQARDTLAAGGRFGVSVDPTEKVDVVENFECIAYDDNGDCVDGELTWQFLTYEIGGFTMEPHPCFEDASIILAGAATVEPLPPAEPIAASASFSLGTTSSGLTVIDGNVISITTAPPVEWMRLPEPALGMPFGDGLGDDVLVEQLDGNGDVVGLACPLTITDDGQVYGHLTYWGQCHIAEPWGPGVCASATKSAKAYADFHTGHVVCADGTDVPTGVLSVGCEHSSAFDVAGVRDHLAHSGMGWADVHVVDGMYGPWLCGVLKPDLTEAQVRLLRSLSLSGEWVGELAGILAVNTPGLPVQRALAASALPAEMVVAAPALRSSRRNGEVTKLVGGNIVRACPECQKRKLSATGYDELLAEVRAVRQIATHVERRTRHLIVAEAAATRSRLNI